MTNDEIINTYTGQDLYNALYLNNIRFLYKLCNSYNNKYSARLKQCGIMFDDLVQECYFCIPKAYKAYEEKGQGMSFLTFLKYPVLIQFNDMVGFRHRKHELLNDCLSLDAPVGGEDDTYTIADTVNDKTSAFEDDTSDRLIYFDVFPIVKEIVSVAEYDIIYNHFKVGLTITQLAKERKCSDAQIRQQLVKAYRKLGKNYKIKQLSFIGGSD